MAASPHRFAADCPILKEALRAPCACQERCFTPFQFRISFCSVRLSPWAGMIRAGISHFSKNTLSLKNNLLKSCTTNKESGKSSPGVVVAIKDNCGYAMTANPIAAGIQWSTEYVNTGAFQSTLQSMAITDFDACGNTQKIIQAGTASTYPAAWAVVNYSPTVAPTSRVNGIYPRPAC